MRRSHILRLGASVTALALLGCTETREPIGFQFAADATSSPATTYSGRATVLAATVLDLASITLGDTGPLPESGGAEESSVLTLRIPGDATGGLLHLAAEAGHASTIGVGDASRSEASVADFEMVIAGNAVSAGFLQARAAATCEGGRATASGSSELARVAIRGQEIAVSGEPNQTIELVGLKVVINEQLGSASGNRAEITVNALHVSASDPMSGQRLADVVIASAHADISCAASPPPPPEPAVCRDFVTGGGWINGTSSGAKGNFGVAGGIKNGAYWGHLTYNEHGTNGPKVKGTGVTAYEQVEDDADMRRIRGTAEVNGQSGFTYEVLVADRGEPGRSDRFELRLSGGDGYSAQGSLEGGNIQLHENCP
jgi:hypothetical protein